MNGYRLCGWRIASEVALPELPRADGEGPVDVVIELGPVPPLESQRLATPVAQVDASGVARVSIAGIADYRIEDGARITVAPHPQADDAAVRLFLFGSVLAQLCHQRSLLPLGAVAVEIDGAAVVLAGPGASGRSTLAAAFGRCGHRIVADDVVPVALEDGAALALPSVPRLALWDDMVEALGWSGRPHVPCRRDIRKHSFALPDAFAAEPLPIAAVIHLERHVASIGNAIFRRLRGQAAIGALHRRVLRHRSLHAMAGNRIGLARCAALAGRVPRHLTLARPLRVEDLDATVATIVETVRASR